MALRIVLARPVIAVYNVPEINHKIYGSFIRRGKDI